MVAGGRPLPQKPPPPRDEERKEILQKNPLEKRYRPLPSETRKEKRLSSSKLDALKETWKVVAKEVSIQDGEEHPEDETSAHSEQNTKPNRVEHDARQKQKEVDAASRASAEAAKSLENLKAEIQLDVHLLSASHLDASAAISVKLETIDSQSLLGESSIKHKTAYPRWEETTFRLIVPMLDKNFGIKCTVINNLLLRTKQKGYILGQAVLTRSELLEPRISAFDLPLQGIENNDTNSTGSLRLRIHMAGLVVIALDRANQLRNADSTGASDPYAAIHWEGLDARKLGRTKTIKDNCNPVWNYALVVPVPLVRPLCGGTLRIDVWDDDFLLGADEFLGQLFLDGDSILRRATPDPLTIPLKGRSVRERSQGSLTLRIFMHPALHQFVQEMRADLESRAVSTLNTIPRCHVNLTVLKATRLRRADFFALLPGDPYAVVHHNGRKLGRTPTRSKTTNPFWDRANTFHLKNVPTVLPSSTNNQDSFSIDTAPETLDDTAQQEVHPEDSPDSDDDNDMDSSTLHKYLKKMERCSAADAKTKAEQTLNVPGENCHDIEAAYDRAARRSAAKSGHPAVNVHIDIFDDDAISRDFLGSACIPWRTLMSPGEHELALVDRPGATQKKKSNRYKIRGTVTVHIRLVAIVEVGIQEGIGLAQNDPYDVSDPYCVSKWGERIVAKTQVRNDNLNPKWYAAKYELNIPLPEGKVHSLSNKYNHDNDIDELRIEVWERDKFSSDDFMGVITVPTDDLLHPSPALPRFLQRRPGKAEDPLPQGYLELDIRASIVPSFLKPRPAIRYSFSRNDDGSDSHLLPQAEVCLRVLRAGNLLRQDFIGAADPFVIVRHNNRVIGKTATKSNTTKPVWTREAFSFTLPIAPDGSIATEGTTEIRLEVWNEDLLSNTFMGVVRLYTDQLISATGVVRYMILPEKPSARLISKYEAAQKVDAGLGWLEIECQVNACLHLNILEAKDLRAADTSGTSDPYVRVRWEGKNARRVAKSWPEKRQLNPEFNFIVPLSVPLTQPDTAFAAVVVEVWDYDNPLYGQGSDDFLGLCVIDPQELLQTADGDGHIELKTQTRRLLNRNKQGRRDQEARGTITWTVDASPAVLNLRRRLTAQVTESLTNNVLDGTHVKFEILSAANLRNADRFGMSDPFVKVYACGKRIGQTSVVWNSINPTWPGDGSESFTIKNIPTTLAPDEIKDSFMVRLSVFDWDTLYHDSLGEAELPWSMLMTEGIHDLQLRSYVFDPHRTGKKATRFKRKVDSYARQYYGENSNKTSNPRISSQVLTRVSDANALFKENATRGRKTGSGSKLVVRVWHVARVRLHLNSAHGLRAADASIFGKPTTSDPYAIVKFQGKTVAKTKVHKRTLDPEWYATFDLEIPTYEPKQGSESDALIEVFDHDLIGKDDFLGCVAIPHELMLRPHLSDIFELGPRYGASADDPVVTGYINLKIESSYIPHALEQIPYPRAFNANLQSSAIVLHDSFVGSNEDETFDGESRVDYETFKHRDIHTAIDEATGKRYWYEKGSSTDPKSWNRWWHDPRPLPPKPRRIFDVPPAAPRPSPTKRKYMPWNEPDAGENDYFLRPAVTVEVNVLSAQNLAIADSVLDGGKSDPYAIIRVGPAHALQTIGKTSVVQNDLDPKWGKTPHRFTAYLDAECAHHHLVIELYDKDTRGSDDPIGMCTISPQEYLNATKPIRSLLRPQPGAGAVSGWVDFRISLLGRITVHVERARFSARPDTEQIFDDGSSDLCVNPKILGWRESALSSYVISNSKPDICGFNVDIPLQRCGTALQINVTRTINKCILRGSASVPGEELLKQRQKLVEVPLRAPDSKVPVGTLCLRIDCPPAVEEIARVAFAARQLQYSENSLPRLATVEIDVMRARNLKKADRYSLSDPYVVGWTDGVKVGQTKVKANTANPIWENDGDSATFRLHDVPTGMLEDDLSYTEHRTINGEADLISLGVLLEVFDDDGPGNQPDFLGHCLVRHSDLLVAGQKELPLIDRDALFSEGVVAKEGRVRLRNKASSILRKFLFPCIALRSIVDFFFKKEPVKGKLLIRIRHKAKINLQILEGYGLQTLVKKSKGKQIKNFNPYCVVEFGGKTLLKTSVERQTYDPCFYAGLELDLDVPRGTGMWDEGKELQVSLPWDHPGRAFQRAGEESLLISVYNHRSGCADNFLGQIVLRPHTLLRPQNGTHWQLETQDSKKKLPGFLECFIQTTRVPLTLEPCLRRQDGVLGTYREAIDQQTGRKYFYDVWTKERFWTSPFEVARETGGPSVSTDIVLYREDAPEEPEENEEERSEDEDDSVEILALTPIKKEVKKEESLTLNENEGQMVIGLVLIGATGLAAKDVNGFSDPYCVVKYNDVQIGRTRTKRKTLDPTWIEEISTIIPIDETAFNWFFELYDEDPDGGSDLLGDAVLCHKTLLENADQLLKLTLRGRPGKLAAQGELMVHVKISIKTIIEVVNVQRLDTMSASSGRSRGLYCAASWAGREKYEVARTATVQDGKLLRWNKKFAVAVPLRFPHDRFRIELRAHNRDGRDTFIGKIDINASTLLTEIAQRKGATELRFNLQAASFNGISRPRNDDQKFRREAMTFKSLDDQSALRKEISLEYEACHHQKPEEDDEGITEQGIARRASASEDDINGIRTGSTKNDVRRRSTMLKSTDRENLHSSRMAQSTFFGRFFFPARRTAPQTAAYITVEQSAHSPMASARIMVDKKKEEKGKSEKMSNRMSTTAAFHQVEDEDDYLEEEGIGDMLTLLIRPGKAAIERYANEVLDWRQRPSANVLPNVRVEVEISRADSLHRSEMLDVPDPFVEIRFGGVPVGKTKSVSNTVNPKWADQRFLLPSFPGQISSIAEEESSRLELRVFDEDLFTAPDLLGYICLSHDDLLATDEWRTLELDDDPEEKNPSRKQGKKQSIDSLDLTDEVSKGLGTLTFRIRVVVNVRLTLIAAYDICKNRGLLSAQAPTLYATVKYLGAMVGTSTNVVHESTSPRWYHCIELNVALPEDMVFADPAIVEFYERNNLGRDTLYGVALIPHEELIFPHCHPGQVPIRSSLDPQEKSRKGWLQIHIEASHVPGRAAPRRRPNEAPIYLEALDPRNGETYWYDKCTGEQFREDPRPYTEALAKKVAEYEERLVLKSDKKEKEVEDRKSPALALLRAQKGFPEPPPQISAAGLAEAAKVSWTEPRENGPPIFGYTIERQRCLDKKGGNWHDKGSIYIDSEAQFLADVAAAKAIGKKIPTQRNKKIVPPTSVLVDQLADDAKYRFRVYSHNAQGKSVVSKWSNEVRVSRPLPAGWIEVAPNDGTRAYYYNAKTFESSWQRPECDPYYLPTALFMQFTHMEIAHLKEVFTLLDHDRSHAISLSEFEACLPELGECLSPSDMLWLYYQAHLDSKAEMNFIAFAQAIDTLKRARAERAGLVRRMLDRADNAVQSLSTEGIFPSGSSIKMAKNRDIIEAKKEEVKLRYGPWRKRRHPQMRHRIFWENTKSGECSYSIPRDIMFYISEEIRNQSNLNKNELHRFEMLFAAVDIDCSGSIDAGEMGLVFKRITGEVLSDSRIRGLIRQFDIDKDGSIDFNEFIFILNCIEKGRAGQQWIKLVQGLDEYRAGRSNQADDVIRDVRAAAKVHRRRRHNLYCVCGCRRINPGQRERRRRRACNKYIFPKIRESELRRQAQAGGATAAAAYDTNRNRVYQSKAYEAATLIASQERSNESSDQTPLWSMIQTRRREAAFRECSRGEFEMVDL